jgi:hypothetical protein
MAIRIAGDAGRKANRKSQIPLRPLAEHPQALWKHFFIRGTCTQGNAPIANIFFRGGVRSSVCAFSLCS